MEGLVGKEWDEKEVHTKLTQLILLLSLPTFLVLQFAIPAPWGKLLPSTEKFGPLLNPRLAWIFFESPNLIWSFICFTKRNPDFFPSSIFHLNANSILLGLFVSHYIHRNLIYPFRIKPKSNKMPLLVVVSGFTFCAINGYIQAQYICQYRQYPPGDHQSPRFLLGIALFLAGGVINVHSDSILINLRKDGETGYKIPRGGCFQYVSAANHFGEMIEWTGFAIASSSLPSLVFLVYTCSNLIPRAVAHHKWYKQKFEDYPKQRKAVIPFVL